MKLDDHGSRYLGRTSTPYPHPLEGPWHVTLHFGEVDGVTECVGLDVRSYVEDRDDDGNVTGRGTWVLADKAQPVTATLIHSMSVGQLVRQQLSMLRDLSGWAKESGRVPEGFDPAVFDRPDGRRAWTSRDLSAVAALYAEALDAKRPPRQAVAEAFDVSGSMASKLIRKARDAGLLGETTQGRPGGVKGGEDR